MVSMKVPRGSRGNHFRHHHAWMLENAKEFSGPHSFQSRSTFYPNIHLLCVFVYNIHAYKYYSYCSLSQTFVLFHLLSSKMIGWHLHYWDLFQLYIFHSILYSGHALAKFPSINAMEMSVPIMVYISYKF